MTEPGADVQIALDSKNVAKKICQTVIGSINTIVLPGRRIEDAVQAADAPRREWVDPSRPIDLLSPLEIDGADVHRAVEQLRSRRILVIECIDSEVQRRTTATIVEALGCERKIAGGVVADAVYPESPGADTGEDRGRWTLESIEHPDLGGGASVLVLEVEGAVGTSLIDRIFASRGAMDALSACLSQLNRYLILLPRGRATDPLFQGHARRGFAVHPLRISFLRPWLDKRFPERAAAYGAALRAQIANGDWARKDAPRGQDPHALDGEQRLYEWLCGLPADHSGEQQLRQRLENGDAEPGPVAAVKEALERGGSADEILLTVVFVAAYLPGLTPNDFERTVEALLGDRAHRPATPAGPDGGQPASPPVEISLLSEWKRTRRSVMRTADLELRVSPDGARIICFRAALASIRLKDLLGSEFMFVESQRDYLYGSELLFDRSRAISQAVTDFVAAIAAEDPGHCDARWMLGLLIRSSPDTRHVPDLPETSELQHAEWMSRHLTCAHRLLRRLIDAAPDAQPGAQVRSGLATVHGVLEQLLFKLPDGAAELGLELAHRLRNAPGFDVWHWIRQAVERGRERLRAGASEMVRRLLGERDQVRSVLERLFLWLPRGDQPPNGAARLAAQSIADCLVASLRYSPAADAVRVPVLTELLFKASIRGGDRQQIAGIVTACFHPLVLALAIRKYGLDDWLTSLLLPDQAAVGDGAASGQPANDLAAAWADVTRPLLSSSGELELEAQLPTALVLALWGHAHASQPAVAQALALAAHDQFSDSREPIRVWLGAFDEVMSHCEILTMNDRTMDRDLCQRWIEASDDKRRIFVDLQRWVAHGVPETERVWMS